MPSRDVAAPHEPARRCDHCGRPVRETEHTRTSYRVDYYTLHTGHGERCSLSGEDGQHLMTYVKLLDHYDIVTCADCYRRPAVQRALDREFRPERAESEVADE